MEQFWQKLTSFAFHRSGGNSAPDNGDVDESALVPETRYYLQQLTGAPGKNLALYQTALTHRSLVHDPATRESVESNQRLEFLGDAVLDLLISDYLFRKYPACAEGELSKSRAKIVNSKSLAAFARSIDLGKHLLLGESAAQHTNIRESESALADAFESLIGAIYLDMGIESAYNFVVRHIIEHASFSSIVTAEHNYKSSLIEYTQSLHLPPPLYAVLAEAGEEHAKTFTVTVTCNEELLGTGTARRKKDAEQLAAKEAMEKIGEQRASENNA